MFDNEERISHAIILRVSFWCVVVQIYSSNALALPENTLKSVAMSHDWVLPTMLGSQQAALWQHLRVSRIHLHFDGYIVSCTYTWEYIFAFLAYILISVTVLYCMWYWALQINCLCYTVPMAILLMVSDRLGFSGSRIQVLLSISSRTSQKSVRDSKTSRNWLWSCSRVLYETRTEQAQWLVTIWV